MFKSLIYPFAKCYALNFLNEKNPVEKQDKLFQGKLKKQSKSVIGKKLGTTNNSKIKDIPLKSIMNRMRLSLGSVGCLK